MSANAADDVLVAKITFDCEIFPKLSAAKRWLDAEKYDSDEYKLTAAEDGGFAACD